MRFEQLHYCIIASECTGNAYFFVSIGTHERRAREGARPMPQWARPIPVATLVWAARLGKTAELQKLRDILFEVVVPRTKIGLPLENTACANLAKRVHKNGAPFCASDGIFVGNKF
jgi:hypothetical protein